MFGFEIEEARQLGSAGRYEKRIEKFKAAGASFPRLQHYAWWLLHNLLAHGFLALCPCKWSFAFHDWSSVRLNAGMAKTVAPPKPKPEPKPEPTLIISSGPAEQHSIPIRHLRNMCLQKGDKDGWNIVLLGLRPVSAYTGLELNLAKERFCALADSWWQLRGCSAAERQQLAETLTSLFWGIHSAAHRAESLREVRLEHRQLSYNGRMAPWLPNGVGVRFNHLGELTSNVVS